MINRRIDGGDVEIQEATIEGEVTVPYSSSCDAVIKQEMDTTITVGGCEEGTNYQAGTLIEKIMRDILTPTQYPRLTDPSLSISATGEKLLEDGATLETVVTASFNRGMINPAYGTSGYRSGPATAYTLNGSEPQSSNSFFATISQSNSTLQGTATYQEGEQPKDSNGDDYGEPWPAGTATSNQITYEFVNAFWANVGSIDTISKQPLVSYSAHVKEFSFPAQTVIHPEVFDIPNGMALTAIEALNPLSGTWDDVVREFAQTATTHNNAAGEEVLYKRYKDTRGYSAGSRKIRIKW